MYQASLPHEQTLCVGCCIGTFELEIKTCIGNLFMSCAGICSTWMPLRERFCWNVLGDKYSAVDYQRAAEFS